MTPRRPSRPDARGVVRVFDAERYRERHPDADVARCGTCGRAWDDAVPTGWTPAPSGRCPYEDQHRDPA